MSPLTLIIIVGIIVSIVLLTRAAYRGRKNPNQQIGGDIGLGALLISGNGRKIRSMKPGFIISSIIVFGIGIILAIDSNDYVQIYGWYSEATIALICLIISLVGLITTLVWPDAKKQTYINVYEGGISGNSISKRSYHGQTFTVKYNEILNVSMSIPMVNIFTQYENFLCYSDNYQDIYNCIMQQLHLANNTVNTGQAASIIYCTACGVKTDPNSLFCGDCGARLS